MADIAGLTRFDGEPELVWGQLPSACTRRVPRMTSVDLVAGFPPGVCMPPPTTEVLDAMADMTPDDITLGELYRVMSGMRDDLEKGIGSLREELHSAVDGLRAEMRSEIGDVKSQLGRVVYTDVFTAEQRVIAEREGAMRAELQLARSDSEGARSEAREAKRMAWVCLFVLVSSVVSAVIVAVVASIR